MPPWAASPLWEREGVTLANSTEISFQMVSHEIGEFRADDGGSRPGYPPVGMNAAAPDGAPPRRIQ